MDDCCMVIARVDSWNGVAHDFTFFVLVVKGRHHRMVVHFPSSSLHMIFNNVGAIWIGAAFGPKLG